MNEVVFRNLVEALSLLDPEKLAQYRSAKESEAVEAFNRAVAVNRSRVEAIAALF